MYLQALINRHQQNPQARTRVSQQVQQYAYQQRPAAPAPAPPAPAPAPPAPAPAQPAPPAPAPAPVPTKAPPHPVGSRVPHYKIRTPHQIPEAPVSTGGEGARVRVPTITSQMATVLDSYNSYDELQNQMAEMRRVAALMKRGYTRSSQTRIVTPPNYNAVAVAGGAVPPAPSRTVTDASGSNRTSPAALENEFQGEMVGRSGPNPLTAFSQQVAAATPGVVGSDLRVPVGSQPSGHAAGTAADVTGPTTFARQLGAEMAVEAAAPAPTSFEAASVGMAGMFSGAPRKSALKKR